MNKFLKVSAALAVALASATALTGCHDETKDLWDDLGELTDRVDRLEAAVAKTNGDLEALQTIINALQNSVTVTAVDKTTNGYVIKFSNGTTATISDGADGTDGTNAPVISVELGTDGLYYWTVDGQPMLDANGQPMLASGPQGNPGEQGPAGADAIAPQVRINPDNKMWEISTDGGTTWISTGVVAQGTTGASGDSLFTLVNTDNPDYIVFVLSNGTEFKVPRYDDSAPAVEVKDESGENAAATLQEYAPGMAKTFTVTGKNIADFTISKPDGWKVARSTTAAAAKAAPDADGTTTLTLTITSPDKANTFAETEGTVAISIISHTGKAVIVKIPVKITYELRTLTFEDADAKFDAFELNYAGINITKWSDLIDSKQYGGALLYGNDGMGGGMEAETYWWYDQNNTELCHTFPNVGDFYCFWSGGHALSNYYDTNLTNGSFNTQLSAATTAAHNGSQNFCVHFGYSGSGMGPAIPELFFYDGIARVVDHMYVANTTYTLNSIVKGDGFSSEPFAAGDYFKIIATGYDASDNQTGQVEFILAKDTDFRVTDWTKWDLAPLGEVARITFDCAGSKDNGYGLATPAYFAYDDVAVRFPIE